MGALFCEATGAVIICLAIQTTCHVSGKRVKSLHANAPVSFSFRCRHVRCICRVGQPREIERLQMGMALRRARQLPAIADLRKAFRRSRPATRGHTTQTTPRAAAAGAHTIKRATAMRTCTAPSCQDWALGVGSGVLLREQGGFGQSEHTDAAGGNQALWRVEEKSRLSTGFSSTFAPEEAVDIRLLALSASSIPNTADRQTAFSGNR